MEKASKGRQILLKLQSLWRTNPLFSTGIALIVMIIVQTIALSTNTSFSSFGEWFQNWLQNWISLLRGNAGIGIIALGMTMVIISGGIDLSVGSVYVTVGAFIMVMLNTGEGGLLSGIGIRGVPAILIGLIAAMLLGSLLGEGNGLLISNGRMPPFIATLGSMQILRSVTQYFMKAQRTELPEAYKGIARLEIGGQQLMPIIYWGLLAAAMYVISKKTAFGR